MATISYYVDSNAGSNGNDTLTPTSVTGTDPYTLTFPVGDLTKQVDATGYDWTLEITPDEP